MIINLVLMGEGKGLLLVDSLGRCYWSSKESLLSLALPRADYIRAVPCVHCPALISVFSLFSSLTYSCPMAFIAQLCIARCKASSDIAGNEDMKKVHEATISRWTHDTSMTRDVSVLY